MGWGGGVGCSVWVVSLLHMDMYMCIYCHELMSVVKKRPTAHYSTQRHRQKYLDHHYLITCRKMVGIVKSHASLAIMRTFT